MAHPPLADVTPFAPPRTVVIGSEGQLGNSLRPLLNSPQFPGGAEFPGLDEIDLTRPETIEAYDWQGVSTLINAAAFTAVDAAQRPENLATAWAINVTAVRHLTEIARRHRMTLVHISSDYVFDGSREIHTEDEPFAPLGVYGTTKAAADEIVATWPRHYLLRTSWVVGRGRNFVATMADLAARGISPRVVDDQFGRLTFSDDIAAAIRHLLTTGAPHGTYNISGDGPTCSWYDIAARVFELLDAPGVVTPVSTAEYDAGRGDAITARRPVHSTLDLSRIRAAGFTPPDADRRLQEYLARRY
ncbi:SDR family oxidoreductase [Acidipropionibacterium acidipropionici]|uniref:SDR family oxidoreductase n=1 Tax=Acidipropionibacterium acidipropionici TaxID=1748 RepID=UPI0039F4EE71